MYVNNKIYVGNLAWEVENEDLRNAFLEMGNVVDALVVKNRRGRSKGFGFVEFETAEAAQKAMAEMNGKEVKGRAVVIREARPPRNDNDSGGIQPAPQPAQQVPAQNLPLEVQTETVKQPAQVQTETVPQPVQGQSVQGEVPLGGSMEVTPQAEEPKQ